MFYDFITNLLIYIDFVAQACEAMLGFLSSDNGIAKRFNTPQVNCQIIIIPIEFLLNILKVAQTIPKGPKGSKGLGTLPNWLSSRNNSYRIPIEYSEGCPEGSKELGTQTCEAISMFSLIEKRIANVNIQY